ncbi:uncharacterized protein LOC131684705 [Topomyia yanbarensis]|uniref:uncharacterized protein LOC131684705 n=1 Tax=Topomyia yanbarensis TaxID=2498891 RepID=UPI00273BBE76|nr:uncharacterized protein LOC131684705 [Topomyia yanbarensis]
MINRRKRTDSLDSQYSQKFLIFYLIWYCRQRFSQFKVGREIIKSKRFNDVFLELCHHQKRWIYLFDVKSRRYKNTTISYDSLLSGSPLSSSADDFNLLNYFKEYLRLRKCWNESTSELIVWTHTEFNRNDFRNREILEPYERKGDQPDFFDGVDIGVRRYRFRNYESLGKELLRLVHPLYELAERVSRLLFQKVLIGPDTIPQKFYDVLLRDVFEDNCFRKDFLEGKPELPIEAKEFREYLEHVMVQTFRYLNVSDFLLSRIDEVQFSAYIKLLLVPQVKVATRCVSWAADSRATACDVDRFFSLLVFYTRTPTVSAFRKILRSKLDTAIQNELSQFTTKGSQLTDLTVNQIFQWIELKDRYSYKLNDNIVFKAGAMEGLESVLNQFYYQSNVETLGIRACTDVLVTVERIIRVIRKMECSNYLLLVAQTFEALFNDLLNIMLSLGLMMSKPFLILVDKDSTINGAYLQRMREMGCSIILVATENITDSTTVYSDYVQFENLTDTAKDRLLSSTVVIQEQVVQLDTILNDSCFSEITAQEFLEWNSNDCRSIGLKQFSDLPNNYINRTIYSDADDFINPSAIDFGRISILSGAAGIGKSVAFLNLATRFQETYGDHIIVMQDSKTVVHFFPTNKDSLDTVIRLIDAKQLNHFQKFSVKKMMDQNRIIVLLDGFDEISHQKERNAEAMLKWIENAPFRMVVVASRPHRVTFLKNCLPDAVVYHLMPFTEQDQLRFLQQRWKSKLPNNEEAVRVIRKYRKLFEDIDGENPLEIPLQTIIIASIYEDGVLSHDHQNIADVFQAFVDKKFDMYANKFFNLSCKAHEVALKTSRAIFETAHAELAFRLELCQIVDYNKCIEVDQYGLLRIDNKTITFIHPSFQKYFVAQYILTHFVEQDCFNQLMSTHFCKPTGNLFNKFLNHHIGKINANQNLLGASLNFANTDFSQLNARRRFKLHRDKVKQFYVFFKSVCCAEQLNKCLRVTIDKDELNTFEVIYDSLTCCSEQTVRFTFNPIDETSQSSLSIDLSAVSEDHVVQLLDILCKKHESDFVEKVIGNFTTDEDDFISTAIEKNYVKVINKLFSIEQNLTNEDETDRIQDYVEKRWPRYLRLVIVHRRDLLLETTFRCVEKRWHPRVTKYFLMRQNVLAMLIGLCEKAEESSIETIQRISDFLREHLSANDLTVLAERIFDSSNSWKRLDKIENRDIRGVIQKLLKCRDV